jgi:hypothetical protein
LAWNKQLGLAIVILLSMPALPSFPGMLNPVGGAVAACTTDCSVVSNFSIASPAFLYLNLEYTDGGTQLRSISLDSFSIGVVTPSGVYSNPTTNPIPVDPSSTIAIDIYPLNNLTTGGTLYSGSYTSGAAGSIRNLNIDFSTNAVFTRALFVPLDVIFRPYDSSTGAGLPIESFNITIQFPAMNYTVGASPIGYSSSVEVPVGLGRLSTFYGVPLIVRVRDYFGNLLYIENKTWLASSSRFCVNTTGTSCSLVASSVETWDLPLQVYSFKVYNQKPDQFIKVKLFWNGSGAGEEVYAPNSGLYPDWWNSAYIYRNRILVNTSTGLNTSFDYNMSFDVTPYTANGRVQNDLRDLRVVFYNFTSMAWTEVNRSYNASTQRLYFKAAAWLAPGTTNRGYFIYYGNALAGAPPTFTPYRTLVLSTSGTVAYWPMDETSGSTFVDITGTGYNCGINGAPTLGVQGEVAKGVDWGDTNGRRCNTSPIATPQFTIDGWYKGTSTPAQGREIVSDHWGSSDHNFIVRLMSTNKWQFEVRAGTSTGSITATTAFTNGLWYHLAFSYDGTNLKAVVNGDQDPGTATATGTFPHITQQLVFAYEGFSDRGLPGSEDEWAFTNRALSLAEIQARYQEGIGQNGTGTARLETANAFEWFESPTETVERFLNPGYYQLQIVTDNRTAVQTKANLGVNITEANYYMVSGTNITRFIGDFQSIMSQTQIIANAFRPDVIAYGELLPTAPSQLHAMSLDEMPSLHDPFSQLTGSTAYTGAAGTNVTSYKPAMSSESSNDGSILATVTVLHDKFVFTGSEPAITHVWINYTNGTNIWENASLPPSVDLAGIQGDVYVVTNRTVSTARISDFRAVWTFSVAYYATSKRYEVSFSLNNSMNRTVYNPYWFVSFPENSTINMSSAAVKDLDNNAWLQRGQNFAVAQDGYYLSFDGLNASAVRRFFFQYYDGNASAPITPPVITVNEINRATYRGSSAYWTGTATWSNSYTAAYAGEIIVKLSCAECQKADTKTIAVVDAISGRELLPEEYYVSGIDIHITGRVVDLVAVGGQRSYTVYTKLTLEAEPFELGPFTVLFMLGSIAFTPFFFGIFVEAGFIVAVVRTEGDARRTWIIFAAGGGLVLFVLFMMQRLTLLT